ncbi:tyrosine-type recombinase/integrase [Polynucleobacter paneuropaeus]|nr:tyrosine-type recombinase/integrase [Polynucleobacter paneuropaeus]
MKMKYVFNNHGQNHFQRSIPVALRRFYGNKKNVTHRLPNDHAEMVREVQRLARHYDAHFKALKSGEGGTPEQIQQQAIALLATYDLLPGYGNKTCKVPEGAWPYPHLDLFDEYFDDQERLGRLNKVDELAKFLLIKPMPILLSQALQIYFDNHESGTNPQFCKRARSRWQHIYEVTDGDIPLVEVTREMARRYVPHRLKSVKTTTVERELKDIRAVINVAIREHSLAMPNPFDKLVIQGKGKDSIPRKPFSIEEYRQIIASCIERGDEIRTLMLVLLLTGARPSEVAGLRREDIHLEDQYPHFDLVEYGNRSLKTKNSTRKVPLIPHAANALRQYLASHEEGLAFPRYCDVDGVKGDNFSATANQYLRSLGLKKNMYSSRHTVKTLLDHANTPEYLAEAIGGWSKSTISRGYGTGHSLDQKYLALEKALEPVLPK